MIPSSGSCGSTAFPVEQLRLASSCRVSVDAALLSGMSPVPGSDAVTHRSSPIKTVSSDGTLLTLASGKNMSSAHLVRSSHNEVATAANVCKNIRSSKQLPLKMRIRRTQLKMLADNLSKFYAPSAGSNRRELLARKHSAVLVERSARERQLEVIRKQVSLVEKRKKVELEVAAAASHSDVPELDLRSVHTADAAATASVSKQKSADIRFNANLSRKRKLGRWKSKRIKYLMQHKQKLSPVSARVSSYAGSMLFACCVNSHVNSLALIGSLVPKY